MNKAATAAASVASRSGVLRQQQVCIAGAQSIVRAGMKQQQDPAIIITTTSLIEQVLAGSLEEAKLKWSDLDGLIAVPSLAQPHFMEAHFQATQLDLFQKANRPFYCKTLDNGGAGPISGLLEAVRLVQQEQKQAVAVVAADCVASMDTNQFLQAAEQTWWDLTPSLQSPAIPHGYDRISKFHMDTYGLTRDQLRMVVCLESFHARMHSESLERSKNVNNELFTSLEKVKQSPSVAPNVSLLECARRADGAACVIVANKEFLQQHYDENNGSSQETTFVEFLGGGEASGPLYPPLLDEEIDESRMLLSCQDAMSMAYREAGDLSHQDIDFFALYDCFPICLVRAIEASGLAKGQTGGEYLQEQYHRLLHAKDKRNTLCQDKSFFPINTHGGLLCYGAPWEVPAMYNVVEAVQQLRGQAKGRQIQDCQRALCYGNGGVLSASAVAILGKSES